MLPSPVGGALIKYTREQFVDMEDYTQCMTHNCRPSTQCGATFKLTDKIKQIQKYSGLSVYSRSSATAEIARDADGVVF